jgi:Amt family ammonium transporter
MNRRVIAALALLLTLGSFGAALAQSAPEVSPPAAAPSPVTSDPASAAPAVEAVQEAAATVTAAVTAPATNSGDTAWMLAASALVLLMTPGLAFFYGGLVRRKNVLSVLMQCFMCMSLMTILWVVVGFSLAFGTDTAGGFIGSPTTYLFLQNLSFSDPWPNLTISAALFMVFQGMFAIITPALILGAFAERMKFAAVTLFFTLWLLLVYCPVAHWVWGGGSGFFGLGADGALDFAGGTVVHINAGIAALVCALVLGKRTGYPDKLSPPHHLPFAVLGAGLLWFGWFGFNAGSAGAANDQAVRAFVVTHIAAAAAGVTWSMIEWLFAGNGNHGGRPTMLGMITGAVAGLVAITPGSGFVGPMGAIAIGAGASVIGYFGVAILKPRLGYDDALDVFGVHGLAGIWGAIATGIFAVEGYGIDKAGGLITGNLPQFLIQFKAVAYTLVYSTVATFILLKIVDVLVGLRVDLHNERVGLDLTDHAEHAYTLLE